MGIKLSIHMQWSAKASIFLWVSHRSVAPENMGKSEPAPVEDEDVSADMFFFLFLFFCNALKNEENPRAIR